MIVETAPETAAYVAALKQKSRKVVALALRTATVAFAAGVSARTISGRGPRSRPVWTLRSRPPGTDDTAPRGARLLSAAGYRLRSS